MGQKELEDTEEKIRQQLEQMPQSKLLMEIKGIGTIITAGILSEIGDIKNYKSYKQIQKLAGYAIVSKSSGKHHGKEKSSKMGRKLLKTILFRAAIVLISTNKAFRSIYDYYTKDRNTPLIKMKAVIAIACKLIRVIYTMLKTGTNYDEKKMLTDIHRPKHLTA
jgi:transposase